jgi:hypothetical protein
MEDHQRRLDICGHLEFQIDKIHQPWIKIQYQRISGHTGTTNKRSVRHGILSPPIVDELLVPGIECRRSRASIPYLHIYHERSRRFHENDRDFEREIAILDFLICRRWSGRGGGRRRRRSLRLRRSPDGDRLGNCLRGRGRLRAAAPNPHNNNRNQKQRATVEPHSDQSLRAGVEPFACSVLQGLKVCEALRAGVTPQQTFGNFGVFTGFAPVIVDLAQHDLCPETLGH